jgi:hypothetical protein
MLLSQAIRNGSFLVLHGGGIENRERTTAVWIRWPSNVEPCSEDSPCAYAYGPMGLPRKRAKGTPLDTPRSCRCTLTRPSFHPFHFLPTPSLSVLPALSSLPCRSATPSQFDPGLATRSTGQASLVSNHFEWLSSRLVRRGPTNAVDSSCLLFIRASSFC